MEFLNFSLAILDWYNSHARELPWRNTRDPYKIWLSEIILQQTRIQQGMNYYYKFIEHYPTVQDLAEANENDVLKDWQGLGYYSRARNLHATAKIICEKHNGQFPTTYKDVIQLKGIGEYTAAAILSFAFHQNYAVLDGNVFRFLSRVFDIDTPIDSTEGKKLFQNLATEILNEDAPDLHNQAMMEMGSLVCSPKPACEICPVREFCLSYKNGTISERPVKSKKIKITHRYFNYLFFHEEDTFMVKKRSENDIWKNLYDFPMIETDTSTPTEKLIKDAHLEDYLIQKTSSVQHILSHQKLHINFIHIPQIPSVEKRNTNWELIHHDELKNHPFPKVIENFLKSIDIK